MALLPGGTTMIRAWMRREHWLIWLTAIVVLTMVAATIGYFTLAHLTVAVASKSPVAGAGRGIAGQGGLLTDA